MGLPETSQHSAVWPTTKTWDWCGEFKAETDSMDARLPIDDEKWGMLMEAMAETVSDVEGKQFTVSDLLRAASKIKGFGTNGCRLSFKDGSDAKRAIVQRIKRYLGREFIDDRGRRFVLATRHFGDGNTDISYFLTIIT
jgi:hypothetical protein